MHPAIAELRDRMRAQAARNSAMVAGIEAELAGRRFVARSSGGLVEAEADRHARLVAIRFVGRGLTRTRGADLGAQVVQAVNRAQAEAQETIRHVAGSVRARSAR